MRKRFAFIVASLTVAAPSVASAQSDCPPGGWFCEEAESEAGDGASDEALEPEVGSRSSEPPVVIYEPAGKDSRAPDKIIVVDRTDPPRPPRKRRQREWGFNLHLQGAIMGDDDDREGPPRHPDSGMGGLGFSLRYRPIPHFAFDAGLDFMGGYDWHGNRRNETALLLNAMIFFNPRSKVQVYTLGGLGFSGARVLREHDKTTPIVEEYGYFGGQLGLGLEFRVAKKTALNIDVLGFLRGRTDEKARLDPEFVDPESGRATNTSGGGLFRGGITFYW